MSDSDSEGTKVYGSACPFCNRSELRIQFSIRGFQVVCMLCFASGPAAKIKPQAVDLWNGRHKTL